MRTRSLAAALGLLLFLVPLRPASADVSVEFVNPQRYTDAGDYGTDTDYNLNALRRHLQEQGQRCLAEGETLVLRVLDVDLAGRHEWWHRGNYDLRVMREITWPRIKLHYVWRNADGVVLGEGGEQVSDMSYLWRSAYVRNDNMPLPYEKAMLRDWFDRRFCRDHH